MNLKDKYFPVLDHGFVALKDIMGGDEDIEQAARVSYGKGTRTKSKTRGLIRRLLRGRIKHTSPFEMVEFKFHVRVPMDTWRQWIRHRTANVNEYSTRYSVAIDLRQKTPPDKWRLQSGTNKQGSQGYLTTGYGETWSAEEDALHRHAIQAYQRRIDCGIAREQARKDLPLSTYTEAFWKIDLHNLLHYLNLRCDDDAQEEIRSYAWVMAGIVKAYCPLTFEAWQDYIFEATTFSRQEMILLRYYVGRGFPKDINNITNTCNMLRVDLSGNEKQEFLDKLRTQLTHVFDIDPSSARSYESFQEEHS